MSTPMDENLYIDPGEIPDFSNFQHFNTNNENKSPYDIDPRLLSASASPMSTSSPPPHFNLQDNPSILPSSQDFSLYPQAPSPFYDADLRFEPLRHQMLGHRRSVSVPPEDMIEDVQPPMVFHRGGHFLGDSTSGAGNSGKAWLKRRNQQKKRDMRQIPYPVTPAPKERSRMGGTRTQTPIMGPTSAPSGVVTMGGGASYEAVPRFDPENGASIGNLVPTLTHLDTLEFGPRTNANTAALGMMALVSRLQGDVVAIQDFLSRGFCCPDDAEDESESIRQEKRAFNHTVVSLDETLDTLPLPPTSTIENVPSTGREIRDLNGEEMDTLLETYGIPFDKAGFVFEKKVRFLRFLGVGRGLMHLVLD